MINDENGQEAYLTTVYDYFEYIIVEAKLKQAGIPVQKKLADIGYSHDIFFGMTQKPIDIYVPMDSIDIAKKLLEPNTDESAGKPVFFDTHVHSLFSIDGHDSLEDCVTEAILKGLNHICFTDHVDMNPHDEGYGFYDYDKYSEEIKRLQDRYSSDITILKGIEFGEPHLYTEAFDTELDRDYDMIIGALHWLGDYFCGDRRILDLYDYQQYYLTYYNEMLDMVNFGRFDVLAHFDFPKRYMETTDNPDTNDAEIDEARRCVLEAVIEKGILLEINTSGYRRGYRHTMPDLDTLQLYSQFGGSSVTIGSDAHSKNDICADFNEAYANLEITGLNKGFFIKRKFIQL